jgi:hypothetical protein
MQIIFEFQTEYGVFRDALHLPDDHGYSDAELDAMKQERVDNWIALVSAPAQEELPVQEETPPDEVI